MATTCGLDLLFENPSFPEFITGVDVYRYAANSLNQVQTQGASLGFNYFLDDNFTLNGNYSWNKLVKTDEDDLDHSRLQHAGAQIQRRIDGAWTQRQGQGHLGLWHQLPLGARASLL